MFTRPEMSSFWRFLSRVGPELFVGQLFIIYFHNSIMLHIWGMFKIMMQKKKKKKKKKKRSQVVHLY